MTYLDFEEEDYLEQAHENDCDYGFDQCADSFLRDYCGCIGCFVIAPPKGLENDFFLSSL